MKTACLCAIAGLLIGTAAFSQRGTLVPANDVLFTITPEHPSYEAGDRILLQYEITNLRNASVYVPQERDDECPPILHIRAWFVDSSGRRFIPGYAGSCSPSGAPATERARTQPVLLKPGQRLKDHVTLDPSVFGLKPGKYRIEAVLSGWNNLSQKQQSESQKSSAPFIRGKVSASAHITLIP
jgi:hypothetical protein